MNQDDAARERRWSMTTKKHRIPTMTAPPAHLQVCLSYRAYRDSAAFDFVRVAGPAAAGMPPRDTGERRNVAMPASNNAVNSTV
jgi:hypothetical protein